MITRDDRNEEPSVAERVIARERVLLDREIELYRLRHLSAPARHPRHRQAKATAQERADARQLGA